MLVLNNCKNQIINSLKNYQHLFTLPGPGDKIFITEHVNSEIQYFMIFIISNYL